MMKQYIVSICLLILMPTWTGAQEDIIDIRGAVLGTNGNPLSGANILIVNTSYGSISDKDGNYVLTVPGTERDREFTLQVRFVGYTPQSLTFTLSSATIRRDFRLVEDALMLGKIVVTAQKREENLQKVPISISAIDARAIEQKGVKRLFDLEYAVPNLRFGFTQTDLWTRVTIRGIGDFSRNIGYESRAAVYVDGVYAGRSVAVNQDLLDLERVEVLRGPQGTLFGKNTVSGAIHLTTRKPHGKYQGKFAVEVGNYNSRQIRGSVNVPLIQNKLFAKVAVRKMIRDGFIRNLFNGKIVNGKDTFGARLQLRYLASESTEFGFSLNRLRDRADPGISFIAIDGPGFDQAPDPRQVNRDANEFNSRDLLSGTLSVDRDFLGDYALRSMSSYHVNETGVLEDLDDTDEFVATAQLTGEDRHFTQEVRLTSPLDRRLNFVTGLYYFYQKAKSFAEGVGGPTFFITGHHTEVFGDVKTHSIAGYMHGNFHLTDKLALTGGLRYTYEDKKIDFSITNKPAPILFINLDHFTDTHNEGVLSPKGGINLQLSDQMLMYGSISRGFKSGGWNADFISSIEQIQFDPEFVTSYEMGLKFTTPNNRFRLNTAAYVSKYDDYQVFQFLQIGPEQSILTLTNAGKVTSKGGEVELSILPVPGLAITAGLGLTKARYDQFKDGGGKGVHFDGNKLAGAPELEYNLAVDYRKRLGQAGSIVFHGDFVYLDEHFTHANNNRQTSLVESYDLMNARVGFETAGDNWSLFFNIQNVTDKLYAMGKGVSFLRTPRAWFGMPRTYTFQLSYGFSK